MKRFRSAVALVVAAAVFATSVVPVADAVAASPAGARVAAAAPPSSGNARPPAGPPAPRAVVDALALDPATEDRILALDPLHVSEKDIRDTLAGAPAPRIILSHGGVFPVFLIMWSFGKFLNKMGYPEASIRDPASGEWSYTPYDTTDRLAGLIAWAYEHEGMRPMMIGHSQGGLFVVKILKRLAGQFGDSARVYDPIRGSYQDRTTIVDPLTGKERPVVGLSMAYGSAVGAGGIALALPAWWEPLATLRKIPDTVDDFTGFFIDADLIALSFTGNPLDVQYEPTGTANVRNFRLPVTYNHITVPITEDLASDEGARAWIDAYVPGKEQDTSGLSLNAQLHVLWAADVWYSIKKWWVLELQRLIRARRGEAVPDAKAAVAPEPRPVVAPSPQPAAVPPQAPPPTAPPEPKPAG